VLPALDEAAAQTVLKQVDAARRPGDLVVVSLHWGGNWVELVPTEQRRFARRLIELGIADIVHGHSAHHPLPIEVHAGRPILYGCGDLLNDYEGIEERGAWRSDAGCLYFAALRNDGTLHDLEIVPLQTKRMRLQHADAQARRYLEAQLNGGGAPPAGLQIDAGGRFRLRR
jgi:poly-gamma-glutamate synthesis protein (capsule biosynthesis protein)